MKKVREFRNVVERLAAMHNRLGSRECGQALYDLGETMRDFDDLTITAFVQRAIGSKQKRPRSKSPR